jgi:toxin YhaV
MAGGFYVHSLALDQLERLLARVEQPWVGSGRMAGKGGCSSSGGPAGLMLERIPRGPLAPERRQGNMLGKERRHWSRAKCGDNRFRLFFRAGKRARVIGYGGRGAESQTVAGGRR